MNLRLPILFLYETKEDNHMKLLPVLGRFGQPGALISILMKIVKQEIEEFYHTKIWYTKQNKI